MKAKLKTDKVGTRPKNSVGARNPSRRRPTARREVPSNPWPGARVRLAGKLTWSAWKDKLRPGEDYHPALERVEERDDAAIVKSAASLLTLIEKLDGDKSRAHYADEMLFDLFLVWCVAEDRGLV